MFIAAGSDVEAVILTGGIAVNKPLVKKIRKRIGRLAPVIVFKEELEMAALAAGARAVLEKKESPRRYRLPGKKKNRQKKS